MARSPQDKQDKLTRIASGIDALDAIGKMEDQVQQVSMEMTAVTPPGGDSGGAEQSIQEFLETEGFLAEQEQEQNAPLDDDEIVSILRNEIVHALGETEDELSQDRARAYKYYYGSRRGDEKEGRSASQSLDVADMVEAQLSQIIPAFTSESIGQFNPLDPADVDQARVESEYVNHVIMDQNHGFILLHEAVKDALLVKNGVIKVCVSEHLTPRTQPYQNMSQDEYMMLLGANAQDPGIEVIPLEETLNPDGTISGRFRIVRREMRLKIESLPPDEFLCSSDHNSILMDEARFVAHRDIVTRSKLVEMGYDPDIVDGLSSYGQYIDDQIETLNRRQYIEEGQHYGGAGDRANDPIEIHECYVLLDEDQDGIAERRKIMLAARTEILSDEEYPLVPFAVGTPYLVSHTFVGLSLYDKLKQVQDSKTKFLRQWEDNANTMNNRRLGAIEEQVNMRDVLNSIPGGVIRMRRPDALFPIPVDDIGPSCANALEYQDHIRTDRAGAALDLQSSQAMIPGESAHGVERQVSAKEMIAAHMTKVIAETLIKSLFLITHATLREFFPDQVPVPLRVQERLMMQQQAMQQQTAAMQQNQAGQGMSPNPPHAAGNPPFAPQMNPGPPPTVTPGEWMRRESIRLVIGLSQGERVRRQQALQMHMQAQMQQLQAGMSGVLVSPQTLYELAMEHLRVAQVPNPERFYIDPQGIQGQQAAQMQQQQQQQQAQSQQQMMQMQMQLQSALAQAEQMKAQAQTQRNQFQAQIDQLKIQLEAAQSQAEQAYDYDKLVLDTAMKLTEIEAQEQQQQDQNLQENVQSVEQSRANQGGR